MPATFSLDHAQRRVERDELTIKAAGFEMAQLNSGTWVEPIQSRLILEPYCRKDAWYTSNAGDYAKLALASFTATGTWETRSMNYLVGPWLGIADSASNGSLITTTTYSKNQGFFFAYFNYTQGEVYLCASCGWNNSVSPASGVSIDFYSDGSCIVYKDGVKVKEGKVTGAKSADVKPGQVIEVILLPYAHRELLICSRKGDGFAVVFDDIAMDATSPTITGATKFWIEVAQGATQVMAAPLKFPASGYAQSVQMSFLEAPDALDSLVSWTNPSWNGGGTTDYFIYGHPAYTSTQTASASIVELDGTAFVADGTLQEARVKITLGTSNQGFTPSVYGTELAYGGTSNETDDSEETDITDSVTFLELTVPDDADGVELAVSVKGAETLEGSVSALRTQCNRPGKLLLDTGWVLDGVSEGPKWNLFHNDGIENLHLVFRDKWALLEQYIFAQPEPLDGLSLEEALTYLVGKAGVLAADITVSTSTFRLPQSTLATPFPREGEEEPSQEWAVMIQVGDTAAQWIQSLMEDYAATWWYGFRPKHDESGIEFYALDPTDLGSTPVITVYDNSDDALADAAIDETNVTEYVIREFDQDVIPPESNDVRVTGRDPRTKRYFQSHKVDTASQTVTTAPSSRPANWLGVKCRYGLYSEQITDQATADWACNLLFDRLTPARTICQFASTLLRAGGTTGRPLWRGDVITIDGRGDWRINSIHCTFYLEESSDAWYREAFYTAEKI